MIGKRKPVKKWQEYLSVTLYSELWDNKLGVYMNGWENLNE